MKFGGFFKNLSCIVIASFLLAFGVGASLEAQGNSSNPGNNNIIQGSGDLDPKIGKITDAKKYNRAEYEGCNTYINHNFNRIKKPGDDPKKDACDKYLKDYNSAYEQENKVMAAGKMSYKTEELYPVKSTDSCKGVTSAKIKSVFDNIEGSNLEDLKLAAKCYDGSKLPEKFKLDPAFKCNLSGLNPATCDQSTKNIQTQNQALDNVASANKKALDKIKELEKKNSDDSESNDETECAVQYFGWVVCPGTRIGTGLVIGFYGVIANNLLDIKSKDLFMTQGGGDQQAAFEYWKIFRDIANVTLAIIISIVIFSQVTNLGLSNYGLKKMLPRLIMFAIIINISFWLVAAFVDFSNIVGSQIFKFLGESGNWELEGEITKSVDEILRGKAQTESGESWTKAFGVVAGVTAVTVAGGTVLAILFAAMAAIFLMFVILTARQAAVIMLVVVSPIAFASAILPNTDGFYNKWKSFLKTMLMIYPICSIMVGGLVLASNVLYKTAVADKNVLFQIVYGLLPMIGLFGTYAVIKGVLSLIDKITGGTGTLSGAFKSLEKSSMGIAKNNALVRGADNFSGGMKLGASRGLNKIMTSDFMKGRSGRFGKISARGALAAIYYSGARSKIAEESHKRSREIMDEDRQIQYLQGLGSSRTPDQNRELARLESARAKRKNEINEAAAHFLAREAKSGQELIDAVEDAINSGNSDKAIQAYMAAQSDSRVTGGMKAELNNKIAQMISPDQAKAGGSMNEFMTQVLSNYGGDIKKTDAGTHKSFTELINGNHALGDLKPANITNATADKLYSEVFSKMSSEQLAEQGNFEVLEKARDNMSATEKAAFQTQIDALAANDKLRSEIGGDKLAILDRMRTPPPAAPQPLTAEQKVAMEGQARLESQIKMFNQQLSDGKISRAQFEDKVRIATAISNNEALIKLETIAQQKAEELRNLADQATREGRHADATKHLSEAHGFEAEAARYKGIDRFDES